MGKEEEMIIDMLVDLRTTKSKNEVLHDNFMKRLSEFQRSNFNKFNSKLEFIKHSYDRTYKLKSNSRIRLVTNKKITRLADSVMNQSEFVFNYISNLVEIMREEGGNL